jgi:GINS complex subunit 3
MLGLLDPHELFAEETVIDTTLRFGATGLGRSLDAGSSEEDVQAGAPIQVPLWLVRPLLLRSMATVRLPHIYNDRYQRKLNAGAECMSLKNQVRGQLAPVWLRRSLE